MSNIIEEIIKTIKIISDYQLKQSKTIDKILDILIKLEKRVSKHLDK